MADVWTALCMYKGGSTRLSVIDSRKGLGKFVGCQNVLRASVTKDQVNLVDVRNELCQCVDGLYSGFK